MNLIRQNAKWRREYMIASFRERDIEARGERNAQTKIVSHMRGQGMSETQIHELTGIALEDIREVYNS